MVITLDFESSNPSSSLGRTFIERTTYMHCMSKWGPLINPSETPLIMSLTKLPILLQRKILEHTQ